MKKIMFNDKYGLTEAVLTGRKTQTRRIREIRWLYLTDQITIMIYEWEEATEKIKEILKEYN